MLPIIVFLIVWIILFVSCIIYHDKIEIIKEVMKLNFKNVNGVKFWLCLIFSFIISALVSYSLV